MTTSTRAIIACPVCQRTLHLDYWPADYSHYRQTPEPSDWDGDMCPCYDSGLVDCTAYEERITELCEEARA